jgi:hypothetical protein
MRNISRKERKGRNEKKWISELGVLGARPIRIRGVVGAKDFSPLPQSSEPFVSFVLFVVNKTN